MDNKNIILWIIGIAILLFLLGGFGMMGFGNSWMYGMMGNYGFGWISGLLVSAVLIAVPILIIYLLIKKLESKK